MMTVQALSGDLRGAFGKVEWRSTWPVRCETVRIGFLWCLDGFGVSVKVEERAAYLQASHMARIWASMKLFIVSMIEAQKNIMLNEMVARIKRKLSVEISHNMLNDDCGSNENIQTRLHMH